MSELEVFAAALAITDASQRSAYLGRVCGTDAALRQRIEVLLRNHEDAGNFLETPAGPRLDAVLPAGEDATQALGQPGDDEEDERVLAFLEPPTKPGALGRLGHYEVLEVLGQGGFGTVVRAFDEKLHRMVAIKIMSPRLAATSPARKRFIREARSSAAIRHENVIDIHAIEEQPMPFLVMEYVAGETLQQRLDRTGPLDPQDVLRIGLQIAHGLAAAHALGKIHRDIKPANILLENGAPRVKITDFGLARAADDASLTQSGIIAGTPMYMAPEQAQGVALDYRADLFSVGSVLYVMCSGRPPFRAPTTLAVLKRVSDDTPRPIREIIPEVPASLCEVITKLHAKRPEDRFQTAQELADVLGKYLTELQLHGKVSQESEVRFQASEKKNPVSERNRVSPPVKPAVETTRPPRPAPRRQSRWFPVVAAIVVLALVGLGLCEATNVTNLRGSVIRLFSAEGTLIVEVDDPDVGVTIDGEDLVIKGAGAKEIRIKPGQYQLQASKAGKILRQEIVTVTKGGRQVVRISRESAAPAQADPDRRAAEYVLSIGGTIKIKGNREELHIAAAGELPGGTIELTGVDLSWNQKVSDAGLASFKDCKDLRGLILNNTNVGDAGLAHFKDCKDLSVLNLDYSKVSDAGLAHVKDCKNLSTLNLGYTKVSDAGLAHFRDCQNLTILWLRNCKVSDAGLALFKDCQNLRMLDLGGTQVSDAGLAHFGDCKKLKVLYLARTQVSDAGLALFKDCSLWELDLGGTQVSDAGLAHFKDCKGFVLLRLGGTQVSDAGLALFKDCKNLTQLELNDTQVSDAGLAHFQDCKNLRRLDVRNSKVSDAGLALFKDCKNLMLLYLGGTQVSDAGLALFKDCKDLTQLYLNDTQVSDAGLAPFKDCKNFTHLYLDGTRVTDAALEQMAGYPNLVSVVVTHTKVTDGPVRALAAALPKCKIVWNGGVIEATAATP